MKSALLLVLVAAAGCMGDVDPAWQLDHTRIVAVRASPPGIASGQTSTIDALLGQKGGMTRIAAPELAAVVSPTSLSDVLTGKAGSWVVTAPDETRLAAARTELMLAPGAPVPLQIGVSYAGQTLVATKTVELGQAADNPPLNGILVDGKPPGDGELSVGKLVKVPLAIDADDVTYDVTWLTSCGTMHDFDLPRAYLEVEADDPAKGELAVVVRDASGGVSWKRWPIHAE
ncbi:MAG TPA: hypothetical protein VF469_37355 [Kofleriaceae bacterium]